MNLKLNDNLKDITKCSANELVNLVVNDKNLYKKCMLMVYAKPMSQVANQMWWTTEWDDIVDMLATEYIFINKQFEKLVNKLAKDAIKNLNEER